MFEMCFNKINYKKEQKNAVVAFIVQCDFFMSQTIVTKLLKTTSITSPLLPFCLAVDPLLLFNLITLFSSCCCSVCL